MPTYDYDNDQRYSNPRAWRNLKASLKKQDRLDQLLAAIETVCRRIEARAEVPGESASGVPAYWNCPRLLLAMALHHFAAATPQARTEMARAYWAWGQHETDWQMNQIWEQHDTRLPCPRPKPATAPPALVPPLPMSGSGNLPEALPHGLPAHAECDGRRFDVVVLPHKPVSADGRTCQLLVELSERRVYLCPDLAAPERRAKLDELFAKAGVKWAAAPVGPAQEQLPAGERAKWAAAFDAAFGADERHAA